MVVLDGIDHQPGRDRTSARGKFSMLTRQHSTAATGSSGAAAWEVLVPTASAMIFSMGIQLAALARRSGSYATSTSPTATAAVSAQAAS